MTTAPTVGIVTGAGRGMGLAARCARSPTRPASPPRWATGAASSRSTWSARRCSPRRCARWPATERRWSASPRWHRCSRAPGRIRSPRRSWMPRSTAGSSTGSARPSDHPLRTPGWPTPGPSTACAGSYSGRPSGWARSAPASARSPPASTRHRGPGRRPPRHEVRGRKSSRPAPSQRGRSRCRCHRHR